MLHHARKQARQNARPTQRLSCQQYGAIHLQLEAHPSQLEQHVHLQSSVAHSLFLHPPHVFGQSGQSEQESYESHVLQSQLEHWQAILSVRRAVSAPSS